MSPDNYVWLLTLAVSSLLSLFSSLVSSSVLAQPKPNHFFKLFHEAMVRQQQIYPGFFIIVISATQLRQAPHTMLAAAICAIVCGILWFFGLNFVRVQDESIEVYSRKLNAEEFTKGLGARDWVRVFRPSVAMFLAALAMAFVVAAGPWAQRPPCQTGTHSVS